VRRNLSREQRRGIESLVRAKGETCGVCGNSDLRSGEDAATQEGGGFSVELRCTNAFLAEGHAGGRPSLELLDHPRGGAAGWSGLEAS
jgi:hypothetical protein